MNSDIYLFNRLNILSLDLLFLIIVVVIILFLVLILIVFNVLLILLSNLVFDFLIFIEMVIFDVFDVNLNFCLNLIIVNEGFDFIIDFVIGSFVIKVFDIFVIIDVIRLL